MLAVIGSLLDSTIGYQGVGLIMLLVMSLLAMIFEFLPVLLAGGLSALTWNYFFTPPLYKFDFTNTEDFFLFLMYFLIAVVNAALSFKAKARNRKLRDQEAKEKAIVFYNTILNSLSHELRTPIATIIGSVDAMNETSAQLSAEHKKELMGEVSNAALRLNQQVENLLGISRLEAGMVKLHLDWTDINELIHSILHKRRANTDHKVHFVPGDNLPLFKLDAILIEQVVLNLIQNAVTYTPEGSQITIGTSLADQQCRIIVRDNGPGFPVKSILQAFDKFYRVEQTNTRGTGLGLSIVKGFVEAHNGTVELTNHPEGGANFDIKIPAETSFVQNLKYE